MSRGDGSGPAGESYRAPFGARGGGGGDCHRDAALKKTQLGLALADELGSERLSSRLHFRRARTLRRQGELGPAKEALETALEISRQIGRIYTEVDCLTELARIAEIEGDLDAAEAYLALAHEHDSEDVWRVSGPRTLLVLARVHLRRGRFVSTSRFENRSWRARRSAP